MTDPVWAVGATAASIAVMYLLCLRPIRRYHRGPAAIDLARDEVARLRREVATLRDRGRTR